MFAMSVFCLTVLYTPVTNTTANVAQGPGDIFVRLVGQRGVDPRASPPTSPAFNLALDFYRTQPTYRRCSGGGNSLLRVSGAVFLRLWRPEHWQCWYLGGGGQGKRLHAATGGAQLASERDSGRGQG
ncbi:hypothetical protein D1007_00698 [Hordeum vulgare]|nr:hypothetical protein D1007_00698 [Hordeum vulgare]